jgi:hypothetical protein
LIIPKGSSEAGNQRGSDNTMTERPIFAFKIKDSKESGIKNHK